MIDSHCHLLSEEFDADREALIAALSENGVDAAIEAGVDLENSRAARALCESHTNLWYLAGVHPHEAKDAAEGYLEGLAEEARHHRCLGIGEIGLDYHYDFSPREVQQRVFFEQMSLAAELGAPVCIHTREATADTLLMLQRFSSRVTGVIHCFSGSVETAKQYLDLGYFLSFGGPVTFRNANRLLDVARMVPNDRILVETDSPYLAPVPKRGKRNEPAYAAYTLECLSALRGQERQTLERQTMENTAGIYQKMVR